jgi:hypothetical protein
MEPGDNTGAGSRSSAGPSAGFDAGGAAAKTTRSIAAAGGDGMINNNQGSGSSRRHSTLHHMPGGTQPPPNHAPAAHAPVAVAKGAVTAIMPKAPAPAAGAAAAALGGLQLGLTAPTPGSGSSAGGVGAGGGGGFARRKRKAATEMDLASRRELEELRAWRRRTEEREKQMSALFSASSSCVVCLDVRPDLVSYGACGHMVCLPCTLGHVTRKLMVMRASRSPNGCYARLASFGLNSEDAEYSCPVCRQGQLDLMGAGLALLPDFAYSQLAAFCAAKAPPAPPHQTPAPHPANQPQQPQQPPQPQPPPAPQQQQQPAPRAPPGLPPALAPPPAAGLPGGARGSAGATPGSGPGGGGGGGLWGLSGPEGEVPQSLSERRRARVLSRLGRDRAAALRALQKQQSSDAQESVRCDAGLAGKIQCPFCGVEAGHAGEHGKMLPTQLLRHVWRCKKRSFVCGFRDCRRPFSWEPVYQQHAPPVVGSSGDRKTESKWLAVVNAAFTEHMRTDCTHMTQCCIGWCEMHPSPARIPLRSFQDHENRHRFLNERFQRIATLADAAIRVERTLAAVLRAEFSLLPAQLAAPAAAAAAAPQPLPPPLTTPTLGPAAAPAPPPLALATTATATASSTAAAGPAASRLPAAGAAWSNPAGPAGSRAVVGAALASAASLAAGSAAGSVTAEARPDVMLFAQPIAVEVHNSLEALNDLLRSYAGAADSAAAGLAEPANLCPMHAAAAAAVGPGGADASRANRRPRTRLAAAQAAAESLISGLAGVGAAFSDGEPDGDDDDDDDDENEEDELYVPEPIHEHDPSDNDPDAVNPDDAVDTSTSEDSD